jgi:hypothetical protein
MTSYRPDIALAGVAAAAGGNRVHSNVIRIPCEDSVAWVQPTAGGAGPAAVRDDCTNHA